MDSLTYKTTREILKSAADKYGVLPETIERLIQVEKSYQLRERRSGIYDSLREIIDYANQ